MKDAAIYNATDCAVEVTITLPPNKGVNLLTLSKLVVKGQG